MLGASGGRPRGAGVLVVVWGTVVVLATPGESATRGVGRVGNEALYWPCEKVTFGGELWRAVTFAAFELGGAGGCLRGAPPWGTRRMGAGGRARGGGTRGRVECGPARVAG